jgi:hypothetical protein
MCSINHHHHEEGENEAAAASEAHISLTLRHFDVLVLRLLSAAAADAGRLETRYKETQSDSLSQFVYTILLDAPLSKAARE